MKERGFTLLELLVAMSVLGLVLVLLTQGMQFGTRAQDQQSAIRARKGDLEAVDLALRRMIEAADPGHYPEPATLRGSPQSVSFTTELPLHGATQLQRADVTLSAEAGQLLMRWRPHRHVELFGPAPRAETVVLQDGVERIELGYQVTAGGWVGTWSADRLPALVRLHLVFDPRSGRQWPTLLATPLREAIEE